MKNTEAGHVKEYLKHVNKNLFLYQFHFWRADYYYMKRLGNNQGVRIALSKIRKLGLHPMPLEKAELIYSLKTEPWARKAYLLTHKAIPYFTHAEFSAAKSVVENHDYGT